MSDQPAVAIREMRKSVRKVLISQAIFVSHNLRLKSAVTIDISTGGMSLSVPQTLEIGQACAVSFDVPGQQTHQRTLIRGNITFCAPKEEGGYRIGVQYVETDPVSLQLIKAAVESYLEKDHHAHTPVKQQAKGSFDVSLTRQPVDEALESGMLSRMLIDKQFHGDLHAASRGEMFSASTSMAGSAGYVALERVNGTLHGRSGSFVLQHSGIMTRGMPQLYVTVVPDSGTEELIGLSGKMTIEIIDGKHSYQFDYAISSDD